MSIFSAIHSEVQVSGGIKGRKYTPKSLEIDDPEAIAFISQEYEHKTPFKKIQDGLRHLAKSRFFSEKGELTLASLPKKIQIIIERELSKAFRIAVKLNKKGIVEGKIEGNPHGYIPINKYLLENMEEGLKILHPTEKNPMIRG